MISTIKTLTLALAAGVLLAGANVANAQFQPLPVAQSSYNTAASKFNTAKAKRDAAQKAYNKKKTPANLKKLNTAKKTFTSAQNTLRTADSNLKKTQSRIATLNANLSLISRNTTDTTQDPNFATISSILTQQVTLNPNAASTFYNAAVAKLGFFNPRANATTLQNSINAIINSATYLASTTRASLVAAVAGVRTGFVPGNPNNGYQASLWVAPVFVQS